MWWLKRQILNKTTVCGCPSGRSQSLERRAPFYMLWERWLLYSDTICHPLRPLGKRKLRKPGRLNWNFMWAKLRGNWCKLTFGRLNWSFSLCPPRPSTYGRRWSFLANLLFTINSIGQTKSPPLAFLLFLSQTSSFVSCKLLESPVIPRWQREQKKDVLMLLKAD